MTNAYSTLAQFYDLSMDVDYEEWVRYLLALTLRNHHLPKKICDLGCGTGNLTLPFAKRGYQLTAVDLSPDMIQVARKKASLAGLEVPFYVQDLKEFNLPGETFDTILSCCDVLNYLTTRDDLEQAFRTVHQLLDSSGLWLFDLNSSHKLEEIYGDQSYADLQENFGYFWDNYYDPVEQICTMNLTFFVVTDQGLYQRVSEQHRQKLWMPKEIHSLSKQTGFQVISCTNFLSNDPWEPTAERWQFVLRKIN